LADAPFNRGFALPSCKDDDPDPEPSYQQVNLVASSSSYGAVRVDTNLVNAWGVAISPAGAFWIASTERTSLLFMTEAGPPLSIQ
jgi:hypothetical protein